MKIRTGFVSNSSSSSFLIEIRDLKFESTGRKKRVRLPIPMNGKRYILLPDSRQVSTPLHLTKKQMNALKKRGYKFCAHTYASRLEEGVEAEEKTPELATHMYLQVVCNEAQEVEYLVKHGIPFEASTHYGHYSVFLQRGKDRVFIARNLGRAIETYKNIREEAGTNEEMLRSQSVKSILQKGWVK